MIRLALLAAALFAGAIAAKADTVFEETFQDGKTDRWGGSGEGDLRLTTYQGNVSLRLKHRAAAVTKVSTVGYVGVVVSVSFAAQSLEGEEECAAELSTDGGKAWTQFHNVRHGQDDAITLHQGRGTAPGIDDNPAVFIGLRVRGDDESDSCWADDIKVTGRAKNGARSTVPATRLSFADFNGGDAPGTLIPFAQFAPPAGARPPSNRFQGKLTLTAAPANMFRAFRDVYGDANANGKAAQSLPPFAFTFVQDGDRIVPVVHGPVGGPHANWEWVLEPGRVWDEDGDQGFTRVGLPFALQERNANCTHYGALTFLFKADGTTSDALFQIAGETCAYFKFDLAGRARTVYQPGDVPGAAAIVAAHRAERAARLKVAPIADLARDKPGADPSQFGSPFEIDPDDMTAFGFVIDGTHYVGGCETRAGPYPDCDVLPLPSYSTAKSIFAGLAAMRIEKLYPGALNATIASLVPECPARRWGDVTLANALNMTTGNFVSTGFEVDERSAAMMPFFRASDHAGKIKAACGMFPRKATPGSTFVYHTVDTYILGTALNALWRGERGAAADIYRDVLAEPVWRKLGLSPDIDAAKRTYDEARQPFTGYGLTYHRDDIARIGVFLNEKMGNLDGAGLFDEGMLRAALQRDSSDRGLIANGPAFRYRNGFFAWNSGEYLKCGRDVWIPFMSGYGGITVALMPNDTVYYYFSDGDVFAWGRAAAESNRMRKFC